jgi:hypothetical protein
MSLPLPSGPFRELLERVSPRWILRRMGERFSHGFIGLTGDLILQSAVCAVRSDLLLEDESSSDAVALLGRERVLDRDPLDTNATYRARVLGAWEAWEGAGAEPSLLAHLARIGLGDAVLLTDSYWTGDTDGGARRIWIILPEIEEGSDGEAEVRATFRIVQKFRAGEERLEDVIGIRTGGLWDYPGGGTWDDPPWSTGTWDGQEAVSYREDLA